MPFKWIRQESGGPVILDLEVVTLLPHVRSCVGEVLSVPEDVYMLTGLPTFGITMQSMLSTTRGEAARGSARNHKKAKYSSNKGTYLSCLTYFTKGVGLNTKVQLVAVFEYWLSS